VEKALLVVVLYNLVDVCSRVEVLLWSALWAFGCELVLQEDYCLYVMECDCEAKVFCKCGAPVGCG